MKIKMQVGEEKTMKEMQTEGLVEKAEAEKIGNEQNLALFLIASWNLGRKWSCKNIEGLAIFMMKFLFLSSCKNLKLYIFLNFIFLCLGLSRPYCEVGPWVDWALYSGHVLVDSGSPFRFL
ncbi:hypothetical protein M9H77_10428 [Catharanthus roseus]|uniref:Uncharacterized protein n=1 Tax=Catharanthus roseus TaxID=4058 RepID=A0ACC0BBP4_CATRO|nr:hypothetical protein M9H77_10428 [Catharanthus roseus]